MTSRPPTCPTCHAVNTPGARFCARCGGALPTVVERPRPDDVVAAPPPRRSTSPTTAEPSTVADDEFLRQRLRYEALDTDFDPISNREFLRVLVVRAVVFWLVWMLGSLVLFLVLGIAALSQAASDASNSITYDYGYSQSTGGGSFVLLYLWFAFGMVWTIAIWVFFWFTKIPVLLSEWMVTVDRAADAAHVVLDHVQSLIRTRRPPLEDVSVVQVTPGRGGPRLYLRLADGSYTGFVSSFAFGEDLFLGWTFWLSQSPVRWVWLVVARAFHAVTLRASALHDSLGFDSAKALREVMHSGVRSGVDLAYGEVGPAAGR